VAKNAPPIPTQSRAAFFEGLCIRRAGEGLRVKSRARKPGEREIGWARAILGRLLYMHAVRSVSPAGGGGPSNGQVRRLPRIFRGIFQGGMPVSSGSPATSQRDKGGRPSTCFWGGCPLPPLEAVLVVTVKHSCTRKVLRASLQCHLLVVAIVPGPSHRRGNNDALLLSSPHTQPPVREGTSRKVVVSRGYETDTVALILN